MVEHPDVHLPSGGHSDVDGLLDLADAAVAALGLSSSAATALEQALEVRTVRDLADNKYVRRAQAIVKLADEKRHGEVSLSPVGACPGEPAEAMGVVAGSRGASNPTPASPSTSPADSLAEVGANPGTWWLSRRLGQEVPAIIGLAVPGRPIGPWPRRTEAPQASATGRDRTPRSVLGPWRTGTTGARVVANGHDGKGATAGRLAFGSGSSRDASGRIRLWSPRSSGAQAMACKAPSVVSVVAWRCGFA
jgi:hypothetical protein